MNKQQAVLAKTITTVSAFPLMGTFFEPNWLSVASADHKYVQIFSVAISSVCILLLSRASLEVHAPSLKRWIVIIAGGAIFLASTWVVREKFFVYIEESRIQRIAPLYESWSSPVGDIKSMQEGNWNQYEHQNQIGIRLTRLVFGGLVTAGISMIIVGIWRIIPVPRDDQVSQF